MRSETKHGNNNLTAIAFAVFAAALIAAFLTYRGNDIGQLSQLVRNLGGGLLFGGGGILASIAGSIFTGLILVSWFGTGTFVFRYLKMERCDNDSHVLELVRNLAVGAIVTSLIWFFLGLAGFYSPVAAIIVTVVGLVDGGLSFTRVSEARTESRVPEKASAFDKALLLLIAIPVVFAFISSLAPPTAKDTLLYHFSVPKAFIAQHSSTFIDGNIASYLSLATEMHVVWAMMLGGIFSPRAAEAAAGATMFLFFPLLLLATFGWAREIVVSRRWSLVATLMIAAVPTAFHVASSGYVDLSLAVYVTLATYSLTRWWKSQSTGDAILIAIFLGAALSVKLTAIFVIAAFALVILLRARSAERSGKVALHGFAALLLAVLLASPWLLRTWAATGSPVFPFYMSIWKGEATGWDVERSNLYQSMNSQYGGVDTNKLNYLTAPARVSITAQPEQPGNYDGVLGVAFLIGLPLLFWALWKFELPVEVKIGAGVAGVMYLFWLFSSEQLRYLLPIVPVLAIAIAASIVTISEKIGGLRTVAQYAFIAASICGLLTTLAWFCMKAPVRVALGGESRDQYLARNLDYYPYYQTINTETPADAKVWLINLRRDTYNIERPVFSDYLFEDWTLKKIVWESRSSQELRAKTAAMGIKFVLTRHDFLFDFDRSTLVDDKKPRVENEAKLKIAKDFILDPANTIRADNKFSLIKVF